mgnify:CR=1 FL=1
MVVLSHFKCHELTGFGGAFGSAGPIAAVGAGRAAVGGGVARRTLDVEAIVALGYPAEFRSRAAILEAFGPEGLTELENAVIVPHIASATQWTRQGMAILAASNVAGLLSGYPVWNRPDILPFITGDPPEAVPSILNAEALGLSLFEDHASSMSKGVP